MVKYGSLKLMFHKPELIKKFEVHKRYIEKMENIVGQEVKELEILHENALPDAMDFETNELIKFENQDCHELKSIFPTIQRKSEIITIYSLLEYELNRICKIYEDCIDQLVKINDLKSNGIIDQSKKYLVKIVGAEFPSNSQNWKEIENIQQIRNSLVHANGLVKTGNKSLNGYITQSLYLGMYSNNTLYIKAGYTLHCVDIIIAFFEELFLSLENTNITNATNRTF